MEFKKGNIPWNKGLTKETDKRVRLNTLLSGITNKGKTPWNKGIPCSEKTKGKISKVKTNPSDEIRRKISLNHADISGENNPNWKDGISFEEYPVEFDEEVKEFIRNRDGYKCQKCGCPEIENNQKLTIHHIDYNKKNCLPSNLISLCRRCNAEVNFNRPKWIKYFQKKIKKTMQSSIMQLYFGFEIKRKEESFEANRVEKAGRGAG